MTPRVDVGPGGRLPHLGRVFRLLRTPHAAWKCLAVTDVPARELLMRLIVPASLVSAFAVTAGTAWFNREWSENFGYDTRAENALAVGGATLLLLVSYTLVLAWVFTRMGRMYRSDSSYADALKVAAYGTSPVWVAGAFMFFMPMALAGMAAFVYACLLYSIGAGVVLKIRDGETAEFVAISLLLTTILMTLFGMAATATGLI